MFLKISFLKIRFLTTLFLTTGFFLLPIGSFCQPWNCSRKTTSSANRPICTRLDSLRTAAINAFPANTTTYNSAINKLCQSALSDASLNTILDTLSRFSLSYKLGFLMDLDGVNNLPNQLGTYTINNNRSISNVILIDVLTANMVGAWKICFDSVPGSKMRLDWDLLNRVATTRANTVLMDSLTIRSGNLRQNRYLMVLKNYAGNCNTCDTPTSVVLNWRLPLKHEYMEALANFTTLYSTQPGFKKFITGEATVEGNGVDKHDGAYHLMSDLTSSNYVRANVVNFEDTISKYIPQTIPPITYLCTNCTYDVQLRGGLLVDYKSYQISATPSADQFKQYLQYWLPNPVANQPAVRSFQYVLNSKKLTLDQAKQKFLTLLKTEPAIYFNINAAFFNRFPFNGAPVGVGTIQAFLNSINTNHPIFDFVIIKP